MPALSLNSLPWLLLAGLLLPSLRHVRVALAGLLLTGLATASAVLVLGEGTGGDLARRVAERGVQPDYLVLNASVLLAGLGLAMAALVGEWRAGQRAAAVLLAVAVGAAAVVSWPLLRLGRPIVSLLVATTVVLLLLAYAMWSDGRRAGHHPSRVREWLAAWPTPVAWTVAALATAAALSPDFGATLLLLAVLLGLLYARGPRGGQLDRWPVLPLLAVIALATAWLAWRAAGADGLGIRGLADAAFSPALQTLLGVLLLPLLFAVAGVPPFDRFVPGAAFAPVAAAILVRGVRPGLGDGVEHWRSAAALWLLLAAADAVRRRRLALLAVCAALFALLTGDETARAPGMVLAAAASLADVVPAMVRAVPAWLARVALGAAAVAWTLALRATLATEVVYSVAMVVVLTAGLLRGAGRPVED